MAEGGDKAAAAAEMEQKSKAGAAKSGKRGRERERTLIESTGEWSFLRGERPADGLAGWLRPCSCRLREKGLNLHFIRRCSPGRAARTFILIKLLGSVVEQPISYKLSPRSAGA